jgi:hypothetical protein
MKRRNALIIVMVLVILYLFRRRSMSGFGTQTLPGKLMGFDMTRTGSTQENNHYPYNSKNHFAMNSELAENYSQ